MKPIIRIDNLGKQYRIGASKAGYATLRESLVGALRAPLRWLRRGRSPSENLIWALKDLSLEIRPGEVVGVVGRNGAGKSTLLKILSRVTEPTTGAVDLYGRVGSLLEVGTGFHPELTGRENIYLNGAVLGMRRAEIRRKFDDIVAFSEIAQFLDTPVKHYSSGMYVRLAFAVAAHLEPEILVVDEVLAVGDAEFQKKCLGKIGDIAHQGRTVLFVSHQMAAVKGLCSRAIELRQGKVVRDGDPRTIVDQYLKEGVNELTPERVWSHHSESPGDLLFRILAIRVVDGEGNVEAHYSSCGPILVEMEFELLAVHGALCIGVALFNRDGVVVFQSCHNDGEPGEWPQLRVGHNRLRCALPTSILNYGVYAVAPKVYLHCINWVLNGEPAIRFEVQIGHGKSPFWSSVSPGQFPGVIAPCLPWVAMEGSS